MEFAERSEQIEELAAALSVAQKTISDAKRDKQNIHQKYMYATIGGMWDACRIPLSENGLSVVQIPMNGENCIGVRTVLLHKSGQYISCTLYAPLYPVSGGINIHSYGSALTYLRKYGLAAVVGIAPDDDDGQDALPNTQQPAATAKQKPAPPAPVNQPADPKQEVAKRLADFKQRALDNLSFVSLSSGELNALAQRLTGDDKVTGATLKKCLDYGIDEYRAAWLSINTAAPASASPPAEKPVDEAPALLAAQYELIKAGVTAAQVEEALKWDEEKVAALFVEGAIYPGTLTLDECNAILELETEIKI